MATFNELIEALETPDDDESVYDAPLEDGLLSLPRESKLVFLVLEHMYL